MYGILNSYIRKVIIASTIMVFLGIVFLSGIIRLVDELRKIGEGNYSIFKICIYIILNLPKDFELFFPVATLLGGFMGLGILELRNEFIAMQVFGFSKLQIALSVIKAVIPILLCGIVSNEWIVPNSEKIICTYRNQLKHDVYLFPVKIKNVWFIDNSDFVHVDYVVTYSELLGVNLYTFNKEKKLEKILYIEKAIFVDKVWHLININELDVSREMCITNKRISHTAWHSTVTPYKISMIITHPSVLSISKLYRCIKYFNKIGQDSKYCQIIFWKKMLSPISGLMMIVMALSCTFGPLCQKQIGFKLFVGSIIGFLFYILDQIFGRLSIICNICPIVAAILPSIFFLIVSVIIIWRCW